MTGRVFQYMIAQMVLMTLASGMQSSFAMVGDWKGIEQGQIRFLSAGGKMSAIDGKYLAGFEIALEPKWKTYWKTPGGSGVPTTVDFSDSMNLEEAETLYPPPRVYDDGYALSLVYEDHVLLPVLISPVDPVKPVLVDAKVSYGVCELVCIPVEVSIREWISPDDMVDNVTNSIIGNALDRIPRKAEAGDELRITDVETVLNEEELPELLISADLIDESESPLLFAYGPPDIYVPQPVLAEHTENKAKWHLPVASIDQTSLNLQFTLVQRNYAVESDWNVVINPND